MVLASTPFMCAAITMQTDRARRPSSDGMSLALKLENRYMSVPSPQ